MSESSAPQEERFKRWRMRAVVIWAIVGACVLFWMSLQGLTFLWQALELLLVGSIVGFACSPLTNWLEDHKVPRGIAALLSLALMLAVLVVLGTIIVGPITSELVKFLQDVPKHLATAQQAATQLWDYVDNSEDWTVRQIADSVMSYINQSGNAQASSLVRTISAGFFANVADMGNQFMIIFLGVVVGYWFAVDYPKIMREFAVIVGPRHDEDMILMFAVLSRSVGGYMRGTLITSAVNGVLVVAGLAIVGHPYAGLMGVITFVLHFVPVIGPAASAISATLLAFLAGPLAALWTMVVMVVAQNVTDNVLSPMVMRSAVKIHPALSLLGIIAGGAALGAIGMVLAIPLTAAIKSVFVYYFETRTGRQLVSEDGAVFGSTPFTNEDGSPQPTFDALDDDSFITNSRLLSSLTMANITREEGSVADAPGPGEGDAREGGQGK